MGSEPKFPNELVVVLSCGFFVFMFYWFAGFLKLTILREYRRPAIIEISNKLVSAVHGFVAFLVGCAIVSATEWDVIYARHWLASFYVWVAAGYGIYDIWSMAYVFVHRNKPLLTHSGYSSTLNRFIATRPLILLHHVGMLVFAFPAAAWYRDGKGDFFIGCFFLTELSTPFVMFRAILSEMDMKKSTVYSVNGLAMIGTFTLCRILIFPFMFYCYANYAGLTSWLWTPLVIPKKCILSCLAIFAVQVYWLCHMLMGAKKIIWDKTYAGVDEKIKPEKVSKS